MKVRSCCALAGILLLATTNAFSQDKKACVEAYDASQAARDAGRLLEARRHLVLCSSEACPAAVRNDCTSWLRALEERIPSVVVRAEDAAGRDLDDAMVEIDQASPTAISGRAISLDPGTHVIRVRAKGVSDSVEQRVVLAEGEARRVVVLRVEGQPVAARAASPAPAPAPAPKAPEVTRSASPWPLVIGGVGIAALGVATYFYVKGFSDGAALEHGCGVSSSCSRDETDSAHAKLVVGDVVAALGLAAVGVGVYLLLRQPQSRQASQLGRLRVAF